MRIKLILHGKLKKVVGHSELLINVDTAQQAVSFLLRSFQGLRQVLRRGMYRFSLTSEGRSDLLSEDSRFDLALPSGVDTIHLVPIEGIFAKRALGIITGIALIGIGVALTFATGGLLGISGATLASVGTGLIVSGAVAVVGGVIQLFTSTPRSGDLSQGDNPEDRQSTLFTSATNRTAKGLRVPVGYGRLLSGSNVISQSILTEEVL
jgi:predicted phage tail protein